MKFISGVKNKNLKDINEALAAGVNINYQTQDTGDTAIHIAFLDSPELLMPLLSIGIDMNIKNNNGRNAVEEFDTVEDEYLKNNACKK